jgi:hypothetical protein
MSSKSTFFAIMASISGLFAFLWSAYATLCLFAFSDSFSSNSANFYSIILERLWTSREEEGPPPSLIND